MYAVRRSHTPNDTKELNAQKVLAIFVQFGNGSRFEIGDIVRRRFVDNEPNVGMLRKREQLKCNKCSAGNGEPSNFIVELIFFPPLVFYLLSRFCDCEYGNFIFIFRHSSVCVREQRMRVSVHDKCINLRLVSTSFNLHCINANTTNYTDFPQMLFK